MADVWSAARSNDVSGLQAFFSKGIGAKARDEKGNTLLHHAAETESLTVMELLLVKGVDLDLKNNDGNTAILSAAKAGKSDSVLWLVAHGANPTLKNNAAVGLQGFSLPVEFAAYLSAAKRMWLSRNDPHQPSFPAGTPGAHVSQLLQSTKLSLNPPVVPGVGIPDQSLPPQPSEVALNSSSPSRMSPQNRRTVNITNPSVMSALRAGTARGLDLSGLEESPMMSTFSGSSNQLLQSEFSRNRGGGSISVHTATQKHKPIGDLFSSGEPGVGRARSASVATSGSPSHSPRNPSSINIQAAKEIASQALPAASNKPRLSAGGSEAAETQRVVLQQIEDDERDRKQAIPSPRNLLNQTIPTPRAESNEHTDAVLNADTTLPPSSSTKADQNTEEIVTTPRKKLGFFRRKAGDESPRSSSAPSTPNGPLDSPKKAKKKDKTKDKAKEKDKSMEKSKSQKSSLSGVPPPSVAEKKSIVSRMRSLSKSDVKPPALGPSSSSTEVDDRKSSKVKISAEEKKKKRSTVHVAQTEPIPLTQALPATAAAADQPANIQRRSLTDAVFTESINLEAITDATCKIAAACCHPNFGRPDFELTILFDAVKAFSAVLKQMLVVVGGYASTIADTDRQVALLHIAEEMKATNTRELFEGIKATTASSTHVEPLRVATRNIIANVWRLYRASEAVQSDDLVNAMQTSVIATKTLISGASTTDTEELAAQVDLTTISALRVSSLVQEFTFSTACNINAQKSMHEAGFLQAQAIRGLALAANEFNRLRSAATASGLVSTPAIETASSNMTILLKKVAEQVRMISKQISDAQATNVKAEIPSETTVAALFQRGVAMMVNARDKYLNRSASSHIAVDEQSLLDVVTSQIQLFKSLSTAFISKDGLMMMNIANATAENVVKATELIKPFLDMTTNQLVREQILLGIESLIRCDIQLKILLAAAACELSNIAGLECYLIPHIVQLWGLYYTLLLDAVWRAAQVTM